MKRLLTLLLCVVILLCACNTTNPSDTSSDPASQSDEHSQNVSDESSDDLYAEYTLPEGFVFPDTDGSTSTTNLDKAVRNAILGGEQTVTHTKTYTSFYNLLDGKCDLIFTTPLSETQLQEMADVGFNHEAEPVAGEGFVFVVNKDNPVDTLTVDQLKAIYSGEITNWKELGGNDAEIVAYQRNADSGSQNYMISFMGDTPLMEPVTDQIPASMSGILDVIANYDNGIDAIGYSVYAYSDGMYENISEIKYIKVNGVEPTLTTLADGSYPLLGYNYAVFSADEPEDSNVRALVKWIQSDKGQQVIANAGYIPYRYVEGLTLPESTTKKLYTAIGTSDQSQPDTFADYYYRCGTIRSTFTTEGLDEKIQQFIDEATAELSAIPEQTLTEFAESRSTTLPTLTTNKKLINGYLSVVVGLEYRFPILDAPEYYYDTRTAVFDIYTGERLSLSDLFFDGIDFVPILNKHLADKSVIPYITMGAGITYEMLADFTGLYEGEFEFTADSIYFRPNTCFADGAVLTIDELNEYMVTSIPRDMQGCFEEDIYVDKKLHIYEYAAIGYAVEKDETTIWYLDKAKTSLDDTVCDKINAFMDNTFETYFTQEKLFELARSNGVDADSAWVNWSDFRVKLVGDRYVQLEGRNLLSVRSGDDYYEYTIIEGHCIYGDFLYFFDAQTGESLTVDRLFNDGWQSKAEYYVYDVPTHSRKDKYTKNIDFSSCRILKMENYEDGHFSATSRVTIILETQNGDNVAIIVPREYIK